MSIKIHGKEYMMVHERISLLHAKYDGSVSIITEIISDDPESIIIKASIMIQDDERIQTFTGHAQEYKNSTQINTTSAYENCETSAIGRACANLGIGIDHSIASAEEVQTAIHQSKNTKIDQNYIPFKKGKNQGKTIGQLDIESLEWIVQESKMREEIKNVADKTLQAKYEEEAIGHTANIEADEKSIPNTDGFEKSEVPF